MARGARFRLRSILLAAAASGAAVVGLVAVGACITTPPPDLPELPFQPPMILHDAVVPREGLLIEWPDGGEFLIPVRMAKAGETFVYQVIADFPPSSQMTPKPSGPQLIPEGGIDLVTVLLRPPTDGLCPHQVEFVAAANFQATGVPDSVGGDVVRWLYVGGGGPGGCPPYDAGSGVLPPPPEAGDP